MYEEGPFETVIPVAEKDLSKIQYVVDRLVANIDTTGIRIITPRPDRLDVRCSSVPVSIHSDDDVIKFDRSRFSVRPNWVMQQFLKVFQDVTETDWFLVIDSDLFFNRRINLFDDGHPVFLLGLAQPEISTDPYFEFSNTMMGIGRVYHHTFLSECTFYNKRLVRQMLNDTGYKNPLEFIERAADVIELACFPADAEMYGSYVWKFHPGLYRTRHLVSWMGGLYNTSWTDEQIQQRLAGAGNCDVLTMHSWEWEGHW